ncbi:uncharacterized protein LOC121912036 [Scomber scombrus]|uniref:Uncharacterized protein LOC121912036 n=1 Tax=Scomber scombrus TaxID=13677 RepID=A0AAV1NNK2_SCOSC
MWHLIVGSLCLFSYDFIQPVSTDDLLCSVTQDDRGTVYSVPEFKAEDCGYSWATADHVLANHMEMMEGIVVTNSNRTLVTRNCSNLIYYTRDCISEDSQLTATCMSNCTRNVVAPDDQEAAQQHNNTITDKIQHIIVPGIQNGEKVKRGLQQSEQQLNFEGLLLH